MQKYRISISHNLNKKATGLSSSQKLASLKNGLANMAVDSLYPSIRGMRIAEDYARGSITHDDAIKDILRLHGVTEQECT